MRLEAPLPERATAGRSLPLFVSVSSRDGQPLPGPLRAFVRPPREAPVPVRVTPGGQVVGTPEAAGRPGDVLVAISTSGNSPGILKAVEQAKKPGMKVVGLTGASGGKMAGLCDLLLNVPSADTPRIQESHILIGHIICEIVEREMFG